MQQKSESEKINGSEVSASASAVKGYNRWKAKEATSQK